jgi:glycosyltransferase involved in cell wall biosynthesis
MTAPETEVLLLAGRFEVRGSSAYTLRLAAGLAGEGFSAKIIAADVRRVSPQISQRLQIREYRRLDAPLWGAVARRMLLREIRRQPPRLIHVQSQRTLRQGAWLARALNRPFVVTMHQHLADGWRPPLDPRYCRRVIAVSESVRDDLLAHLHLAPEVVTVIPSGVETDVPENVPLPLQPGQVAVIGTAGPLEAVKGFPWFLGAARQILEERIDVEFLVAGAGPEEANLRRVARELGISGKVTFVPYVQRFTDALAATDIFCLPSLQQGLGTIMLEAMALGRPVIATGVGGVASVIRHGETGLIVPPQNSGELARRVLELLDQPTRARALGARARQMVIDEFNVASMVKATAQVYREAIAAHPLPQIAMLANE